nr:MAG TPA: hypothetical protein [Caudoviricetes sp.]
MSTRRTIIIQCDYPVACRLNKCRNRFFYNFKNAIFSRLISIKQFVVTTIL